MYTENKMDWQLFGATFVAIFLAELGDKTQLATMSMASSNAARGTVFVAAALALVLSTALAVLLGDVVARYIPLAVLQRLAGAIFLVLGLLYLCSPGRP